MFSEQETKSYLKLLEDGSYKEIYFRMLDFESDSFSFENFPEEWKPEVEYWVHEYKHLTSLVGAKVVFSKDDKKLYLVEYSNKYVLVLEGLHDFYVSYKVVFKQKNKKEN